MCGKHTTIKIANNNIKYLNGVAKNKIKIKSCYTC